MANDEDLIIVDEFGYSEMRHGNMPRIDLVDSPANGTHFLIMKSSAEGSDNLLGADFVRGLIQKAEGAEMVDAAPGVDSIALDTLTKDAIDQAEAEVDLVVTDLVEQPTGAGGVAASVPGSPEWEQVDAESGAKIYSTLARVKAALGLLEQREIQEAVTGDPEADMNAWDLSDAASAIDYAMSTVAVYAAGEATEGVISDELTKSLQGLHPADVEVVETYGAIRKSGRTLSAANETKLRSASESISAVLASLPAAPDEVTKQEGSTVTDTIITEPVVTADPITKADAADAAATKQLVFDAAGKPLGIVDPAQIEKILGAGDDAPEDTPAAAGADAATTDVTAADDTVAKAEEPDGDPSIDDLVKAAVNTAMAERDATIDELTKKVEHLGAPAPSKVNLNGVTTARPVTREGGDGADTITKEAALDLREQSNLAGDTVTKKAIDDQRGQLAFGMLLEQQKQVAQQR